MLYWFNSYGNFAEWVGLHREGSAPAACTAGSFLLYLKMSHHCSKRINKTIATPKKGQLVE